MANEITINATLQYDDGVSQELSLQVTDLKANVTTTLAARFKQTIGITEEAIQLCGLASLGYVMFVNVDDTNFISIKSATSGVIVGKLFPGECYGPVRLGSGMQAPFAIADTAPCDMDILIIAI